MRSQQHTPSLAVRRAAVARVVLALTDVRRSCGACATGRRTCDMVFVCLLACCCSCYAFARDVNCEFKHGVLPVKPADRDAAAAAFERDADAPPLGRVSIIAWGWVDQTVAESRIRTTP